MKGGMKMLRKCLSKIALFILPSIILLLFFTSISLAGEASLPVLKTEAKAIAIFKNGLGFFIREGDTSLKGGWAVTEYVPNSTLGSLWIGSLDEGATLEEVIGFREEIEEETEAISIDELLKANVGNKVIIIAPGEKTITGKIKSVPEDRKLEQAAVVRYPGYGHRSYVPPSTPLPPKQASIVIIDTTDGEVALNKHISTPVKFPDGFNTKFLNKEKSKRIKFKVATRRKKAKLSLSYLQKGISWVPSYLVNIENPKKARITMRCTLVNDVEDLENVNVYFVVGFPNFIYADTLSPMALEESITQFIRSLREGSVRRGMSGPLANIMTQQSVSFAMEDSLARGIPRTDYGYPAIKGLSGAAEEDLFLYHKKSINLNKGERAYYHIFSDEVEYKHIYEWEIPDTIKLDARGYQRSGQQRKEEREQVWHSIKLTNSTDFPWTTAPAFVISDWKPLSQDMIKYTPKGTKNNLKLTVATDIKTDRHEYEIDRERQIKLYHRNYDLVTVKGELYIKNCKTKDVTMELKKKLTGEVVKVSHNGKIEKIAEGLKGVNQNSVISWEIPIKAGQEITVTYSYKVYVTY